MEPRKITIERRLNIKGTQTLEPKVNREIALFAVWQEKTERTLSLTEEGFCAEPSLMKVNKHCTKHGTATTLIILAYALVNSRTADLVGSHCQS